METILQALLSGLASGGIYALIALGFSITFTTTKTLNFSQGEVVSFGAFIGVSSLAVLGMAGSPASFSAIATFTSAVVMAGVISGLVGIVLFVTAVRPFAGKPGMSWVMSTVGFGVILQNAGLLIWGPAPAMVPSPLGDRVIQIFGAGVRPQELLVIGASIAVMLVFDMVMRRSRLGKAMRAVSYSPQIATLMGINVSAVMIGAFAMSSALAGFAGVMVAPIATASLFMGLGFALKAFAAAIVGGLDSPRGCIFGGFCLGIVESGVSLWEAQWREIIVFGLIILVLSLKPSGLFGRTVVDKV